MESILKALAQEVLLHEFTYDHNEEIERKVQENLAKWQSSEQPLAPLNDSKLELIYQMREALNTKYFTPKPIKKFEPRTDNVNNYKDFYEKFLTVEAEIKKESHHAYDEHKTYIDKQSMACNELLSAVKNISGELNQLSDNYNQVSTKINSLHNVSEQLMKQQTLLKEKKEEINERLVHFTLFNTLNQNIQTQSYNLNDEKFIHVLEQINTSMTYLGDHPEFRESFPYKLRYEQLLSSCLANVVRHVNNIVVDATQQVVNNADLKTATISVASSGEPSVETAFSYYYGKFQNAASKTSNIIRYVENNVDRHDAYERSLMDFYKSYFSQRTPVMQAAVSKALHDLRDKYKTDHGILFRSAALFIVKVCQDETACYQYFFRKTSQQLSDYLYSICQNLYDVLRPCLIGINHIEVLTELCTILKEMVGENVQNNPALDQFVDIIKQLLQDVEERLVFRTNIFFQYDIHSYEPSPGDLAYPEKLEQMEDIAEELRRPDSRGSSVSVESQEVAAITAAAVGQFRSFTGNSPADLHGMWYPTVKRTLVCLSRLYICLDRETFQGVSQEGLLICVKTIDKAAERISARKTVLDGKLFQIKHLLIIREQIAPFQVDFTIKELSLDFTHFKSAAAELVHNRNKIFQFNSNNAILEFLLEGTPRVKEYLIDSRKEIDKQLKSSCEAFIANTTSLFIGALQQFLQKGEYQLKLSQNFKDTTAPSIREQVATTPQIIAGITTAVQRNLKLKIPDVQKSMRLYLANRETEFILFRPIKNNIINAFIQLEQFLIAAKYTQDDMLLIGCPTAEQLNVLISSVSLMADQEHHQLNRGTSHSNR